MLQKEIDKKILDYFDKKLMLKEVAENADKLGLLSNDEDVDLEDFIINSTANLSNDNTDEAAEANAYEVLKFFPVDKTQFIDPEIAPKERNLFGETENIDTTINSLLFSTRLLYLDTTPIKPKELLSVVAMDSYGYMNIVRANQIDILTEEIDKVQDIYNKTDNKFIQSTIKMFNKVRLDRKNSDERYLNYMISFYAENVLNPDLPMDERKAMIREWLEKKLSQDLD